MRKPFWILDSESSIFQQNISKACCVEYRHSRLRTCYGGLILNVKATLPPDSGRRTSTRELAPGTLFQGVIKYAE